MGWVFVGFGMADAIEKGAAEWEFQFDQFINGFLKVRDTLQTEEVMVIVQRVFGGTTLKTLIYNRRDCPHDAVTSGETTMPQASQPAVKSINMAKKAKVKSSSSTKKKPAAKKKK